MVLRSETSTVISSTAAVSIASVASLFPAMSSSSMPTSSVHCCAAFAFSMLWAPLAFGSLRKRDIATRAITQNAHVITHGSAYGKLSVSTSSEKKPPMMGPTQRVSGVLQMAWQSGALTNAPESPHQAD
eukprot:CAMPEP_0114607880 /NCGR_PEP_ID=MMETSP0168-20121206/2292_1 /TAXON_ID=95228 ORGANISM="Vannella sp., Strain DIVA3 517/6/12" /NCGR_SAMPLE_ID=MMETSP0168 /ASSEMBLY_ACC=CAM_ASM_000044 /LENGTH=128 /DNA_ID=CAMNT_0001818763 /DNA_START=309 /DNA_END=694 /DNA_ORIENTATION=-